MSTPVIINKFDADNPFEVQKLNDVLQLLISTINALSADTLLQFGVTPGGMTQYMLVAGGQFSGQIGAPAVLIGPVEGTQYPVVTSNDMATEANPGLVRKVPAVPDTGDMIFNIPSADGIAVTSPDAPGQGAAYDVASVQAIATLANETKADMNTLATYINNDYRPQWDNLVAGVNAHVARHNDLLAKLRAAGILSA